MKTKWCAMILVVGILCMPAWGAVQINEIRIDQTSTDNDEYFELMGTPSESLDGLTYLVIGDGTGASGVIEYVLDLTGYSINANGFFVVAESTFSLGTADLTIALNFENSDNVTHLLVQDFTGASGDDLDADDDCTLDVTPWTAIVDSIALLEDDAVPPASTECGYGPPSVGPDGPYVPGHVYYYDGVWYIGPFDIEGGADSPGAANDSPTPNVDTSALLQLNGDSCPSDGNPTGCLVAPWDIPLVDLVSGGAGTTTYFVAELLPAADGTLSDAGGPLPSNAGDYPVEVTLPLEYTPPSSSYTGTAAIKWYAEVGGVGPDEDAFYYVCVQDTDSPIISEVMAIPLDLPLGGEDVYEYIEVYNGTGADIPLWGLTGNLLNVGTDGIPNNLSGRSLQGDVGDTKVTIIAPGGSAVLEDALRCEWRLNAADVIFVDAGTWDGIRTDSSLVALYGDTGGTPSLVDAVWVRDAEAGWPDFYYWDDRGRSLAWDGFGVLTSWTNEFGINWKISGLWIDNPSYNENGLTISESRVTYGDTFGSWGNPGYVAGLNPSYTYAASCMGQCCLPAEACSVTFESDCVTNGCGVFTFGGDCDTYPDCSATLDLGACCTDLGLCYDVTQCECEDVIGGTFFAGTDCGTQTCTVNVGVGINEIDYDNQGTDTAEFVELIGPPGTDLTGWTLELYNGNGGVVYNSIALTGSIPADGYYVIGSDEVANVDQEEFTVNGMQNGPPDGLVLCDAGTPVELIAYEGTFDATDGCAMGLTLPDIGVSDGGYAGSMQKIPDLGTWTATTTAKTPGEMNSMGGGACCLGTQCVVASAEDCTTVHGLYQGDGTVCGAGLCTETGTCKTVGEAHELPLGVGVHICDAILSNETSFISSGTGVANFQMQDIEANGGFGITVFGGVEEITPVLSGRDEGDLFDIYGVLEDYNGVLELTGGDVLLERGTQFTADYGIPTPAPITVEDMQNGSPTAEDLESRLVVLGCVEFLDAGGMFAGGTSYDVTNDGGLTVAEVRVSHSGLGMDGQTIPTGYVDIVGVFSQYDFASGDDWYQLLPRSMADLTTANCGACCDGGACSFGPAADCTGTYMGDGIVCTPNPCAPIGSCCLPHGECVVDLTAAECAAAGGNNWIEGGDCVGVTCDPTAGLVISEIVDATLPGGLPKFVELTNCGDASIDLSYYSIGNYSNGGTTLGGGSSALLSGTLAPGESYVISYEFNDEPGIGTFYTTYGFDPDNFDLGAYINGNDVLALFFGPATDDGTDAPTVDLYGEIGVDGVGTAWEYTDGFSYRLPGNGIGQNPFVPAEWYFGGADSLEDVDDEAELLLILANTTPGTHQCEASEAELDLQYSCAEHNGVPVCIELGTGAKTPGDNIDPRICAVTQLQATFTGVVGTVTADVACDVTAYAGTATVTVAGDGLSATIDLDTILPDEDCCTVTLGGDAVGSFKVRTLKGDVDRNGSTLGSDMLAVKPNIGAAVSSVTARFDVDCSGQILGSDMLAVKPYIGGSAPSCP